MDIKITTYWLLKLVPYPALVALHSRWIDPNIMNILGTLLIVDITTGLLKTLVIEGWKWVKSRTGIIWIVNKLLVFMLPPLFWYVWSWLGFEAAIAIETFLIALCLYEFYSILGNILSIRKWEYIKQEGDVITFAIENIMQIVRGGLNKFYELGDKNFKMEKNKKASSKAWK